MSAMIGAVPGVLFSAIKEREFELVKFLLDNGADPNERDKNGCTPLHTAAQTLKDYELSDAIINLLVEKGAELDAINKWGISALIYATRAENIPALKLLIDHGASLAIKDNFHRTALDWANDEVTQEVVEMLKEAVAQQIIRKANVRDVITAHQDLQPGRRTPTTVKARPMV